MTNRRDPNLLPYAPRPRGVRPLAEIEAVCDGLYRRATLDR